MSAKELNGVSSSFMNVSSWDGPIVKLPWRTIETASSIQDLIKIAHSGRAAKFIVANESMFSLPRPISLPFYSSTKIREFSSTYFSRNQYWTPSIELLAIPFATFFSKSNILLMNGRNTWEELEYDTNLHSTGIFADPGKTLSLTPWYQEQAKKAEQLPGVTFLAQCKYSGNYTHWHTEVLSQCDSINNYKKYFDRLATPRLNNFQSRSIELSSLSNHQRIELENSVYHFRVALIMTNSLFRTWLHPNAAESLNHLRDAVLGKLNVEPSRKHPIYLSRLDSSLRKMINEKELCDALAAIGVSIVTAGNMTYDEQVRTFADASMILSPHGSGLTNMLFTSADTQIIELRPINAENRSPLWDLSYRNLAAALGRPYSALFFDNETNSNNWSVEIQTVINAVKQHSTLSTN